MRIRSELLGKVRRVVVKIGSQLLREEPDELCRAIAGDVKRLSKARSLEVTIVSSGAIALGMKVLGWARRPKELPELQAAAAIGQGVLMQHWERAFAPHGFKVGQVLLTHADLTERDRFLNARHVISALAGHKAIPIINENDAVAVDEIKFGDNDQLAALVCNLVTADALVIMTDVDGLYDADPRERGQRIAVVKDIDAEAKPVAGGTDGQYGTGGMASKVQAAQIAGLAGIPTVVASGRSANVLEDVLTGADRGTLFLPSAQRLRSRKHWIAFARRPAGTIAVDDGARNAIEKRRKSLLPSGIREVTGKFMAGDLIRVVDSMGNEFARGLAGYGSAEILLISGRRSADISTILGYKYLDEVIHRDDLVVLEALGPRRR